MTPDDVAGLDVDVYTAFVEYMEREAREIERARRRR
jgi:hypothetical protein